MGGISCATFGTFRSLPSLPRPHPMRQGIVTTKSDWRFERREFQACFGQTGGLWSIHSSIKRRVGRTGREKSMLTQKSVLSIAGNPHGCRTVTQSAARTLWTSSLLWTEGARRSNCLTILIKTVFSNRLFKTSLLFLFLFLLEIISWESVMQSQPIGLLQKSASHTHMRPCGCKLLDAERHETIKNTPLKSLWHRNLSL